VYTEQGRAAPLLAPLRALLADELPSMPGANVLGEGRPGGVVLWAHPTRTTKSGAKMPVLAIGDEGNGRAIALGVDGGWMLQFSAIGARTAGRGHGALWDGLLGWLMRDPRFEPAQMELTAGGCTAGLASTLRVRMLPVSSPEQKSEELTLDVIRIDAQGEKPVHLARPRGDANEIDLALPPLAAGGYSARLRIGHGPATRRDFACEVGGDEWADSRPDADRLRALAKASGGTFAWATDDATLPLPKPTVVSAERHVMPIAPAWLWALVAALAVGVHWVARRRSGLA
jgi:hypothetical protein